MDKTSHKQLELNDLISKIISVAEYISDMKFYKYQEVWAWNFLKHVLLNTGEEITTIFSRQSGKSQVVASTSAALLILLPWLAEEFPEDERLNAEDEQGNYRGYKKGISIGIYAPVEGQAKITFEKLWAIFCKNQNTKELLKQNGIYLESSNQHGLRFNNGGEIQTFSASKQSNIEGETHHIAILEEAQDIDDYVITKSIYPIVSSVNGLKVLIGTPNLRKSYFYRANLNNKRLDKNRELKNNFEFNSDVCGKYNSFYKKAVENQKEILGEDSDAFRMSYKCEWILEKGMFITEKLLLDEAIACRYGKYSFIYEDGRDIQGSGLPQVMGIDFGRSQDATVATVCEVDWDNPLIRQNIQKPDGTEMEYLAFQRHVVGWLRMHVVDWETQFFELLRYIMRWPRLMRVIVDSTNNLGDSMLARFGSMLGDYVRLEGLAFNQYTKNEGYNYLSGEFSGKRLTFPYGIQAQSDSRTQRFIRELVDLEKHFDKSGRAKYHAPENMQGAHDDYPDSLMLAVYGSQVPENYGEEVVVVGNNFLLNR